MISDITKHSTHYSALAVVLGLGILGVVWFRYDAVMQMIIVVATAGGYVAWGLVHHYLLKDLNTEIVLEYIIIAVLVVSIFWAFLL